MPDSPSGVYTLPPSYKVANGALTDAAQHNPPFEDVEQGLTNRLHRDGRTSWTGDQNANGNKLTGLTEGTNDSDAATVSQAAALPGDFKDSTRTLDANWLRRDGALYDSADYPDLAASLPALPDGVTWSSIAAGTTGTIRNINVMSSGFRLFSYDGTDTKVYTSPDARLWSSVATISSFYAYGSATDGNIHLAVNGMAGTIASSNDGLTWGKVTVGTSPFLYGSAFGVGLFVITGDDGDIYSSDDLVSWTPRASGVSENLIRVRFINGLFVAVGALGVITTSPDGINWTPRTSGTTTNLTDVAYGSGLYVVTGWSGAVLSSPDLATWTPRTSGTTAILLAIVHSTSGFMAVGAGGVSRISGNGIAWTGSATGVGNNLNDVIYDPAQPNRYLAVGDGGVVVEGIRTLPTQFRVPNDDPTYGWIRAK